jgi:hypothetical protein
MEVPMPVGDRSTGGSSLIHFERFFAVVFFAEFLAQTVAHGVYWCGSGSCVNSFSRRVCPFVQHRPTNISRRLFVPFIFSFVAFLFPSTDLFLSQFHHSNIQRHIG